MSGQKKMRKQMDNAKIIAEELRKLHVTEEDDVSEVWRHTMNALLSKVASAILNAETRMLNEETDRLNKDTAKRQTNFLRDHAVGNH